MNIYKAGSYNSGNSMSDLICDNYPMLLVMSRFNIDLGFGDQTIGEVCHKSGVDVTTFLAVVNLLITEGRQMSKPAIDFNKISLASLITYLHNSHAYFLEYRLPTIRRELIEALDGSGDVGVVVINYFDEYVSEVDKHMSYEESRLFPYIDAMISGERDEKYCVDEYSRHHDQIESKLSELKGILIKYYPTKTTYALNNVLYDIFACERDLAYHNSIENNLLVPAIRFFESQQRITE